MGIIIFRKVVKQQLCCPMDSAYTWYWRKRSIGFAHSRYRVGPSNDPGPAMLAASMLSKVDKNQIDISDLMTLWKDSNTECQCSMCYFLTFDKIWKYEPYKIQCHPMSISVIICLSILGSKSVKQIGVCSKMMLSTADVLDCVHSFSLAWPWKLECTSLQNQDRWAHSSLLVHCCCLA